jgi:hypothetical protein
MYSVVSAATLRILYTLCVQTQAYPAAFKSCAVVPLTLIKMALWRPDVEWPTKRSVLAVPPLQLIQKILS